MYFQKYTVERYAFSNWHFVIQSVLSNEEDRDV